MKNHTENIVEGVLSRALDFLCDYLFPSGETCQSLIYLPSHQREVAALSGEDQVSVLLLDALQRDVETLSGHTLDVVVSDWNDKTTTHRLSET